MSSDNDREKWATNIAFTGNKETVKNIIKHLNSEEESGNIDDLTLIEGPYKSLQEMLKDRKKNLSLSDTQPIGKNSDSQRQQIENSTFVENVNNTDDDMSDGFDDEGEDEDEDFWDDEDE